VSTYVAVIEGVRTGASTGTFPGGVTIICSSIAAKRKKQSFREEHRRRRLGSYLCITFRRLARHRGLLLDQSYKCKREEEIKSASDGFVQKHTGLRKYKEALLMQLSTSKKYWEV
jgi:hypothetical protein